MADFRSKLAASANRSNGNQRNKDFKIINMQSKTNQGTMFIVPISPIDGSDPIAILNNVLEVKDYFDGKDKDGKPTKMTRWLKLLDKEEYADLSSDEKALYKSLRSKGKELSNHTFNKDKRKNDEEKKKWIRNKNYTLILAYVIEHKDLNGKVINKNIPALLVFASSRLDEALDKALKAKDVTTGGQEWQTKLFNRDKLRKQFMTISYRLSDNPKIIGYIASVSIEKFDDETTRLTNGKEDGLHMDDEKTQEMLKACTNPINIFLNIKLGEKLFKEEYMENLTNRLNKYLNKFCGQDNPVADKKVDPTAEKVKMEEKDRKLPPENEPAPAGDIWDTDGDGAPEDGGDGEGSSFNDED